MKLNRSEIGKKIRANVEENFETYFLAVLCGGMASASFLYGMKMGRNNVTAGIRFGEKSGWYRGFAQAMQYLVEDVTRTGEQIVFRQNDGTEWLINATKKISE